MCNLSIQEAATQVRDAVVGPIEVVGRDSAWTEDPLSILSKPDSSNTQVLSFQSVIEDIDAESRRNYSVGRISSSLSLIVTLTEVSGKTSVEIYVSSVTGISAGMVNLVLDDARSRINQSLKYN